MIHKKRNNKKRNYYSYKKILMMNNDHNKNKNDKYSFEIKKYINLFYFYHNYSYIDFL